MIATSSSAEAQGSPSGDSRVSRLAGPFLRSRLFSDKRGNATRPERFHLEGIQRLSLAIINCAVRDLLDQGRHSPRAERWLLSREFDHLHELLG